LARGGSFILEQSVEFIEWTRVDNDYGSPVAWAEDGKELDGHGVGNRNREKVPR
jgi:hypothetical protein